MAKTKDDDWKSQMMAEAKAAAATVDRSGELNARKRWNESRAKVASLETELAESTKRPHIQEQGRQWADTHSLTATVAARSATTIVNEIEQIRAGMDEEHRRWLLAHEHLKMAVARAMNQVCRKFILARLLEIESEKLVVLEAHAELETFAKHEWGEIASVSERGTSINNSQSMIDYLRRLMAHFAAQ